MLQNLQLLPVIWIDILLFYTGTTEQFLQAFHLLYFSCNEQII